MKVVGARIPRYDGVAHVTGRTTYVDDVNVPGTLWAKALRSPHHHAGITKLDTTKAESMPGVHAVITWKDVPLLEYGHLSALGIPADEPLLAKDEVRYLGQPIALVAAESEAARGGRGRRDRGRLRGAARALRRPPGVRRGRPEDPSVGQLVPALRERDGSSPDPQGRHRLGLRERGHDRPGRLPPRGDRARAVETQVCQVVPEPNGRLTIYSCTQALYFSLGVVAAHLQQPLNSSSSSAARRAAASAARWTPRPRR